MIQLEAQVVDYQGLVEKLENDLAKQHPHSSPKITAANQTVSFANIIAPHHDFFI